MRNKESIIEVINLSKKYEDKIILKDVNFKVKTGEIFSIVGPSGKGKSTLAKILLGLEKLDTGDILFKGVKVSEWMKHNMKAFRKKIQIVLQNSSSSFNPKYNVEFIMKEPYIIHKLPYKRGKVVEALEAVGLTEDFLKRYPYEMSGGQRQRISIARALILMPELIVMDEVLRGLDVILQAQIIELILRLKKTYGFTLIFISHNMDIIKFISDNIYYL